MNIEKEQEIIKRYPLENAVVLAKAFNTTVTTICKILKKYGIEKQTKASLFKDKVIKLYNEGKPAPTVAKELGLGSSMVYRILHNAGIQPEKLISLGERARSRKFDKEQEQSIINDYSTGMSLSQVAKKHNSKHETIWHLLKRNGVELRPRGNEFRVPTTEQIEELIRKWEAQEPKRKIAKDLGISTKVLDRWIHYIGKTPRGTWNQGENHHRWKGGRIIDHSGYIRICLDQNDQYYSMTASGYVPEHRYNMAQHLGRPLLKTESVHHINGDKTDNRIENLQLRIGQHGNAQAYCCAECGSNKLKPIEI